MHPKERPSGLSFFAIISSPGRNRHALILSLFKEVEEYPLPLLFYPLFRIVKFGRLCYNEREI